MNVRDRITMRNALIALLVVLVVAVPIAALAPTGNVYTSGSTFKTDSGLAVTFEFNQTLDGNPFVDSDTFEGTNGTISARSTGSGDIDVAAWGDGSATTVVNDLNTSTVAIVNPDQSSRLGVNGTATEVTWNNITPNDGSADVITTASNSDPAGLFFLDLTPGDDYRLRDSNGNVVDRATANGNGNVYLQAKSSDSFKLQQFSNEVPSVTDLSPSQELVDDPIELAATVDDDSLPGSNVTVTFRVDGSVVHSTTIVQSKRVNYTLTQSELPAAGTTSWSVTATDALGGETTESTSFFVAGNMTVRNVTDTSQVIPSAQATIYTDAGALTRSADANGNISLEGLPGSQVLVFEVNATDYYERTIAIQSVVQAGDAYLIPRNTTTVLNRFTLNDPTGQYPSDSLLLIERPVNINGSTEYRTVAADKFGVEGFSARLIQDQRYRLTIISPSGDVAQLGKYVATQSEEIPLRPESATVRVEGGGPVGYNETIESGTLRIQYNDSAQKTDVLTVYVVNRFNDSDYLIEPQTFYGTNNLSIAEPIPGGELSDGYKVVYEAQRSGEDVNAVEYIGPDQVSLVPSSLSQVWLQIIGVGLVLVVGGVFSTLNVGVGAVVTSLLSGILWYIGLLGGVATWGTIAAAIVFSIGYGVIQS